MVLYSYVFWEVVEGRSNEVEYQLLFAVALYFIEILFVLRFSVKVLWMTIIWKLDECILVGEGSANVDNEHRRLRWISWHMTVNAGHLMADGLLAEGSQCQFHFRFTTDYLHPLVAYLLSAVQRFALYFFTIIWLSDLQLIFSSDGTNSGISSTV